MLLKLKVKEGAIPLYDGAYVDIRELHNDVALFVCRIRDLRGVFYARCCNAFNREEWPGFLGEMQHNVTFRESPFLLFAERLWQHESLHRRQFLAVGETIASWDEVLLTIINFLESEEERRNENLFHVKWKSFKKVLKAARVATWPPNVQPHVDKLQESMRAEDDCEEDENEE